MKPIWNTLLRRALQRRSRLLVLSGALLLAGCDAGAGVLSPSTDPRRVLPSGLYDYRAWQDGYAGGAVWWGALDLEVYADGEISGYYRLPYQCVDDYGYEADCVGRVGGRVDRDGTVRFGLDEGWLANFGDVQRSSRVTGSWEGRFGGYDGEGTFELVPYYD
jgi:hypothetical protein